MREGKQSGSHTKKQLPSDAVVLQVFGLVEDLKQMPRQYAKQKELKAHVRSSGCTQEYKDLQKHFAEEMKEILPTDALQKNYRECMEQLPSRPSQLTQLLTDNKALRDCIQANIPTLQRLNELWTESTRRSSNDMTDSLPTSPSSSPISSPDKNVITADDKGTVVTMAISLKK